MEQPNFVGYVCFDSFNNYFLFRSKIYLPNNWVLHFMSVSFKTVHCNNAFVAGVFIKYTC